MREDQRKRLDDLSEQLTDEALTMLDPSLWPGANIPPDAWNAKIRGDRHWMLKNANAAVSLLVNVKRLAEPDVNAPPASDAPSDEEQVEQATKSAQALMKKLGIREPAKR